MPSVLTHLLVASIVVAGHLVDGPGDPLKIKPIQKIAGGDSSIHAPLVRLISDDGKWTELWNIHKGVPAVVDAAGHVTYPDAPKPPTVDFAKNQVLVVFGGKLPNVQAYDYVKTYDADGTAVVQLSQGFITNSADIKTYYPYILLVVPKEPVKIEVQLDSVAKDGSHFWMTIAKYGIPKGSNLR
jgi:hypothetical protein